MPFTREKLLDTVCNLGIGLALTAALWYIIFRIILRHELGDSIPDYIWWANVGVLVTVFVSFVTYSAIFSFKAYYPVLETRLVRSTTISSGAAVFVLAIVGAAQHAHPVRHLWCIAGVFATFALHSAVLVLRSAPSDDFGRYVRQWLWHTDAPTFVAYSLFAFVIFIKLKGFPLDERYGDSLLHLKHFVAGAIAFHMTLSGILFLIGHVQFLRR